MKILKTLLDKDLKDSGEVSVEALDRALDVETVHFGPRIRHLVRHFRRRRASLDLASYREQRRQLAANSATAAQMTVRGDRAYTEALRRCAPMDREEEFKMARRHEFAQQLLITELRGLGIDEQDARQLLRQPAAAIRAAVDGRRTRRKVDRKWLDGFIVQFEQLRNLYVEGALHIVLGTVHRYRGLGVEVEDLIQEGNASLFQAIDGFDWRRDVRFRTYAQYWVQQAVLKMLYNHARTVRVPIWVQKVLGKIRRMQESERREGRELTVEELAERLELPPEQVEWVLESRRYAVSLDAEIGNEEGSSLARQLADENLEPIPESISPGNLEVALGEAMADLPDRERQILSARFGLDGQEPRTLVDIARDFGITPERVRQLQIAALGRMQKPTKLKKLEAFVE